MTRARFIRRGVIAISVLAVAALVLGLFVRWSATQGFGHRFMEGRLAAMDVRGQRVRVEGLYGDLLEAPAADRISVSDAKGVWLTAESVKFDWRGAAFLRGELQIGALLIEEVTLHRRPVFTASQRGGRGLKGVRIQSVSIDNLIVASGFAGQAMRLSAEGSADLKPGAGAVTANVRPQGVAPGDRADISLNWSATAPLTGTLSAKGEPGGLIAGVLELAPGLAPQITADFTRDLSSGGVSGDLIIAANAAPVFSASGLWTPKSLRGSGDIKLTAFTNAAPLVARIGDKVVFVASPASDTELDISAVAPAGSIKARVPFDYAALKPGFNRVPVSFETRAFSQVSAQSEFDAEEVRGKGTLSFDDRRIVYDGEAQATAARIDFGTVARLAGPMRLDWNRETRRAEIRADLKATGVSSRDAAVKPFADGDGTLNFEGVYAANQKALDLKRVTATTARGNFTAEGRYVLNGAIRLNGRYDTALADQYPATHTQGRWWADGERRITRARLSGEATGVRNVAAYLDGRDAQYDVQLRRLGTRWRLEDGRVRAPGLEARVSGDVIDGALRGTVDATMRQFVQRNAVLNDARVTADIVQTEANWMYDGVLTARSAQYETRTLSGITLAVRGTASDLSALRADMDGSATFLGQTVTIAAQVSRAGDRWSANAVTVRRPGIAVRGALNGSFADALAVRGKLSGEITKPSGLPFEGTMQIDAPDSVQRTSVLAKGVWTNDALQRPVNLEAVVQPDASFSNFDFEGVLTSGAVSIASTRPVRVTRVDRDWQLKGRFRVAAEQTVTVDLDAAFKGDAVTARYAAEGPSQLVAAGDVSIPWPLRSESVIRITSKGSGRAEDLWALAAPSGTRLSGAVSFDVTFSGPRNDLRPQGRLALANGTFEHLDAGLVLREIKIDAAAAGNDITFQSLSAKGVRGGTLEGTGVMSLDGLQDVTIRLNQLQPLRRKDSDGVFNGTLTLQRRDNRTLLAGDIFVERANIKTDRFNANRYVTMNVRFEDDPPETDAAPQRQGVSIPLDIRLRAERQLKISGRAFETEWSGDVRLRGTLGQPEFVGEGEILRGYLDIAGRRFQFADSRAQFDGPLTAAKLYLAAERDAQDLTAIVRIEGPLAAPEISFASDPALPEDEVLSRVLFGQAPAGLGTVDALQLAAGAADLTSGRGFGLFGQLEAALGVDQVNAGVDEAGKAFVSTGAYIADDVYADVRTNDRGVPRVAIEWTPERYVVVGTTFGASEEPRFTVKWRTELGEAAPEPEKSVNIQ